MNYVIQGHGRQEVAAAGTPEALGSDSCRYVLVQALKDNATDVTVGGEDVDGADATRNGVALAAGDILPVFATNLSEIYVDAITNDDGVSFVYFR